MYNEEIKEMYLTYYADHSGSKRVEEEVSFLRTKFDLLEEQIETPIGKDVCNLTREEVISNLGKVLPARRSSSMRILSLIRVYTQFCVDNNLLGCKVNVYNDIKLNDISGWSVGSMLIKDELMLTNIMNTICRPIEEDYVDNLYRVVYHLLFYGFSLEDVVDLKWTDYNEQTKTIFYPKRNMTVQVSDLAHQAIMYTHDMTSVKLAKPHSSFSIVAVFGEEYILKRCRKDRTNYAQFLVDRTSRYDRLISKANYKIRFTPFCIMQSGIFWRVYQNELKTGNADFTEFVNFRLRQTSTRPNAVREAYVTARDEYDGWKRHYGL